MSDRLLDWSAGAWRNPPVADTVRGGDLIVEAAKGSDAWLNTSYGFARDSAHGLLAPLGQHQAMEVTFTAAFSAQFDQAGILLHAGPTDWIKAGVEYADGAPQVGAVVTHGNSDWSVAPVPEWSDRVVTVRASRSGDAVTVRARTDGGEFRLVRVAYLDPEAEVLAGPYCCAPSRGGLLVAFHRWSVGPADGALH